MDFDIWDNIQSEIVENSLLSKRNHQFPIQKKSLEDYSKNSFILNNLRLNKAILESLTLQYNDRRKDSEYLIEMINKELENN